MHSPGFDRFIPSLFLEQLKRRTNELQSRIVRANYNTQFAQTASELAEFRHAIAGLIDQIDDETLSEAFRKTVHFTTYDSYAPLLARFSEKPCKASAIVDLFAPGRPDYLAKSSSTSGGLGKIFPKYNLLSEIRSSDSRSWTISDPLLRRTTAFVWDLWWDPIDVEDENNRSVTRLYKTAIVYQRSFLYLDPEKDEEKMGTFILDHAAPYAAGFIKKWRSFLLIHALFAVGSRSLESMSMPFICTFVDIMRYLDMEFDMVVDCIANGTIPDLDGIAEVRHYLEMNMLPDPERAAELRTLGRPSTRQGWCSYVWPNLRTIISVASGSFASSLPLAQWYLGPDTEIRPRGYGSTEAVTALPYNPPELNLFKLTNETIVEFLDMNKSDSISSLKQMWEVEQGKRYETVLTTKDGLWRYRLGDVIEICGFDPTDGVPVISFIERRTATIRFPDFMVTEKELRAAMLSFARNSPMKVVDWTSALDERSVPPTVGFFVELAGDEVPNLTLATEHAFDELLCSNQSIAGAVSYELFRKPTVRVVRAGTFGGFRQLKLDEGGHNLGLLKVPVVLPKAAYVTWFTDQVVREF